MDPCVYIEALHKMRIMMHAVSLLLGARGAQRHNTATTVFRGLADILFVILVVFALVTEATMAEIAVLNQAHVMEYIGRRHAGHEKSGHAALIPLV